MAKLYPNRFFFGYQVWQINEGAGADALKIEGGFYLDKAIGAGSYPNAAGGGSVITSQGVASSKCRQGIRFFQSQGIDCRGNVDYQIFGESEDNPEYVLTAGDRAVKNVEKLDVPELGMRRKLAASNRSKDAAFLMNDDGFEEGGDQDVPA